MAVQAPFLDILRWFFQSFTCIESSFKISIFSLMCLCWWRSLPGHHGGSHRIWSGAPEKLLFTFDLKRIAKSHQSHQEIQNLKVRGHLSKSGPVFDDFKPPLSADGDEILKLFALKAGLRNHTEEVDQTANSQEPCSLSCPWPQNPHLVWLFVFQKFQ